MGAKIDYNDVVSLSPEEFKARTARRCASEELQDPQKFTKANHDDIVKIERLIDVRPGTLAGEEFYLGTMN